MRTRAGDEGRGRRWGGRWGRRGVGEKPTKGCAVVVLWWHPQAPCPSHISTITPPHPAPSYHAYLLTSSVFLKVLVQELRPVKRAGAALDGAVVVIDGVSMNVHAKGALLLEPVKNSAPPQVRGAECDEPGSSTHTLHRKYWRELASSRCRRLVNRWARQKMEPAISGENA